MSVATDPELSRHRFTPLKTAKRFYFAYGKWAPPEPSTRKLDRASRSAQSEDYERAQKDHLAEMEEWERQLQEWPLPVSLIDVPGELFIGGGEFNIGDDPFLDRDAALALIASENAKAIRMASGRPLRFEDWYFAVEIGRLAEHFLSVEMENNGTGSIHLSKQFEVRIVKPTKAEREAYPVPAWPAEAAEQA